MLPSGNDAAQTICENVGKHLANNPQALKTQQPDGIQQGNSLVSHHSNSVASIFQVDAGLRQERASVGGGSTGNSSAQTVDTEFNSSPIQGFSANTSSNRFSPDMKRKKDSVTKYFLERMNKLAQELNMHSSSFCNPHGLMNKYNHSSSRDMAVLLNRAANEHPEFSRVISTLSHTARLQRDGEDCKVEWRNTHKCFDDPRFLGGKTGITVAAGPCLASRFKLNNGRIVNIVVLNSRDVYTRVAETKKLCDWVENNYRALSLLDLKYP